MKPAPRWIGVFLIAFAFAVMLFFIIIPAVLPSFDDAPLIKNTFRVLFCKPGETLLDEHATYRPSPGTTETTVSLSCVDNEGQSRDVGSAPILVGIVGYLVPFLSGLLILTVRSNRNRNADRQTFVDNNTYGYNATNLSDRLRELKSAYDAGLVTQDEYEAKRKEILSDL